MVPEITFDTWRQSEGYLQYLDAQRVFALGLRHVGERQHHRRKESDMKMMGR
jgi:hypothetical protein